MISCYEHCSSAASVTLNCHFSDFIIFCRPLVFVQLLSPFLYSSPSHSCFLFFQDRERESAGMLCLVFALPRKGKGSWASRVVSISLARVNPCSLSLSLGLGQLLAAAISLLTPFFGYVYDLSGASSTQYTWYSFLHLHCQLLVMCWLFTNLC